MSNAQPQSSRPAAPAIGGSEAIPESGTVTVGCKWPPGLTLRMFRMVELQEPVMGGGINRYQASQPTGIEVRIKGFARGIAATKSPLPVTGEYALTPNVDAAFFRAWMEQNKDSDMVKNGLIFCHKSEHAARDMSKERHDLRSGLDPLNPKSPSNPKGDHRIPQSLNPNLSNVETLEQKEIHA